MFRDLSKALNGTQLEYTYAEMGTVVVRFVNDRISFEWIDGLLKGQAGNDFPYHARKVGDQQYFLNWHEPEERGFVTLFVDLKTDFVCSSVLAAYATDDQQALFHCATINRVEKI